MKTRLFALVLSVLSFSCDKDDKNNTCPEPQPDCTGIVCILQNYNFDFRVVDKNSGADLVWGPNPRYIESDIALFADQAGTQPIPFSADAAERVFRTGFAEPEMYLIIAGTDIYKLGAEFRVESCCNSRVKNLDVNGQELCSCCGNGIEIPVE